MIISVVGDQLIINLEGIITSDDKNQHEKKRDDDPEKEGDSGFRKAFVSSPEKWL